MNREAFVETFQKQLARQFSVGYQNWWSEFLFHYSDIRNVISILNSGKLYSRNRALALGLMQNDNADDDVIDHTGLDEKAYVRFYFGALTPTQYHNEGFKPKNQIAHNAHCPVPVFLLFDFIKILSRNDSHFSSGNIASSGADIYSNIEDLNKLEFEHIYHRGYIQDEMNRRHITYCRHAEVLIPEQIDIYDCLEYVIVRSEAEKETLLHFLNDDAKQKLEDKIRVYTNGLFYADRFYIEKVVLNNNTFEITFNKSTHDRFDFEFKITDIDTSIFYIVEAPQISMESKTPILRLRPEYYSKNISLQILIDGSLAHSNDFQYDQYTLL